MRVDRIAVVGSLLALAACTEQAPVAPLARPLPASLAVTTEVAPYGPWARIVEGETGPGSIYRIYVPADWNGDAMIYAHGIRDVESPIDLRDQDGSDAVRDQLGAAGFLVAYSSYSVNGFAIKDGAQRTHQLRGLVAAAVGGPPRRTFLAGHSLGAAVALSLVERFPAQYDGALLMCGVVGGSRVQTDYVGHVRALADLYFPGRFQGNAISYPEEAPPVALPEVIAAVQANPLGLLAIASTAQSPLPWVPVGSPLDPASPAFQTMVGSLFGALNFHSRFINNVVDVVHGKSPFGNVGTTYALGTPLPLPSPVAGMVAGLVAQSDAAVARYTMDRSAANYLEHYFTPTGDLQVPVLTIHNTWDPGVPAFHETVLRDVVAAAGRSSNLLQRYLPPGTNHCSIPPSAAVKGFTDLVGWASTGSRPTP
jgi:pimeloyl-ACP methyl ester carboxylesterase